MKTKRLIMDVANASASRATKGPAAIREHYAELALALEDQAKNGLTKKGRRFVVRFYINLALSQLGYGPQVRQVKLREVQRMATAAGSKIALASVKAAQLLA